MKNHKLTGKSVFKEHRFFSVWFQSIFHAPHYILNQLHRRNYVEQRRSMAMIARKMLITVFEASNLFPDLHPELVFVQVLTHQRILLLKERDEISFWNFMVNNRIDNWNKRTLTSTRCIWSGRIRCMLWWLLMSSWWITRWPRMGCILCA